MPEKTEQLEKSKDSFFDHKSIVRIFILVFGGKTLKALGLPISFAYLLSGLIAVFVDYWVPPRPKESFSRYFVVQGTIISGIILAVFVIPPGLMPFMPTWLAYFLPIVLFSILSYFLFKIPQSEPAFLRWVLGCILLALVLSAIFQYVELHV